LQIFRSIKEPIRPNLKWEERWGSVSLGLISSWERGREKGIEAPKLAAMACDGQLVLLPWKGGVEKSVNKTKKYGVFNYLAMWQGLRHDDLCIDLIGGLELTCSQLGQTVIFIDAHFTHLI